MNPEQNPLKSNQETQPISSDTPQPVVPNSAPLPPSSKPPKPKMLMLMITAGVILFVGLAFLGYKLFVSKDKVPGGTTKTNTSSTTKLDTYIKFGDQLFDYHLSGDNDAIYDKLIDESAYSDPRLSREKLAAAFDAYSDKCYEAFKLGVPTQTELPSGGVRLTYSAKVSNLEGDTTSTDTCSLTLNVKKNTAGEYRLYVP